MDKRKQRIAIAEACGWKREAELPKYAEVWINPDGFQIGWRRFDNEPWENPPIPDFLNDLNAIHEAEKKLTDKQKEIYVDLLFDIAEVCALTVTFASSAQRAEAFLRTIGKWEE